MTAKKKKPIIALAVVSALLTALIIWIIWGNTALQLNKYTVSSERLPRAFDGCKIAPCYYVTGNHEARASEYDALKTGLIKLGVTVLENEKTELERDGEKITLIGVKDPSFSSDYLFHDEEAIMEAQLKALVDKDDGFTLLLSHRPELFEIYVTCNADLVLSGHAHGGQFRLPFIGGLAAPNQGLFPKYDAGLFSEGKTKMLVSRGIGNSIFPFRFNNRPEIILIELQTAGA